MEFHEAVETALREYQHITGLRGYLIKNAGDLDSASERNYFCKCLKTSNKALSMCKECAAENFQEAISKPGENIYCCHAGLIKWTLPVQLDQQKCVIVMEGVLSKKQLEESGEWAKYLEKTYHVDASLMERTLKFVKVMDGPELDAGIALMKHLLTYYLTFSRATVTN